MRSEDCKIHTPLSSRNRMEIRTEVSSPGKNVNGEMPDPAGANWHTKEW